MNNLGRGKFLKPYGKDGAFLIWIALNALSLLGRIAQNSKTSGFNVSNSASIISGLLDGVLGTAITALFFWIVILPYLIYRQKKLQSKESE